MTSAEVAPVLLELEDIIVRFSGMLAVDHVSLRIRGAQRVGVIGPNGAGKSTLANCVTGYLTPNEGRLRLDGHDLSRAPSHRRARAGISRTFQNLELFSSMTVFDNVLTALDAPVASRVRPAALRQRKEQVHGMLDLFGIGDQGQLTVETLSYGTRKLVELARAMVRTPKLLVLDEPAAGLASGEKEHLAARLGDALEERGCALLLIEHDMPTVRALCEHVYVLDAGLMIAQGSFAEIATNPAVIEAYLGSSRNTAAQQPDPGPEALEQTDAC